MPDLSRIAELLFHVLKVEGKSLMSRLLLENSRKTARRVYRTTQGMTRLTYIVEGQFARRDRRRKELDVYVLLENEKLRKRLCQIHPSMNQCMERICNSPRSLLRVFTVPWKEQVVG